MGKKPELRLLTGLVIGLLAGLGVRTVLLRPPTWEKLPPTASVPAGLTEPCDPSLPKDRGLGSIVGKLPDLSSKQCYDPLGASPPVTARCVLSSEAFSPLTFPPADVQTCVQSWSSFAESSSVEAYVRDSRGDLWRWRDHTDPFSDGQDLEWLGTFAVFCCTIAGLVIASYSAPHKA